MSAPHVPNHHPHPQSLPPSRQVQKTQQWRAYKVVCLEYVLLPHSKTTWKQQHENPNNSLSCSGRQRVVLQANQNILESGDLGGVCFGVVLVDVDLHRGRRTQRQHISRQDKTWHSQLHEPSLAHGPMCSQLLPRPALQTLFARSF